LDVDETRHCVKKERTGIELSSVHTHHSIWRKFTTLCSLYKVVLIIPSESTGKGNTINEIFFDIRLQPLFIFIFISYPDK